MRRLVVVLFAVASMGKACDPCPTGTKPAPGVSLEEIIDAIKAGNPTETPLCVCRDGYEPNGPTWIQGCHPSVTPTTVTMPSTPTPTPTTVTMPSTPTPTPKPTATPSPTPSPVATPTPPVEDPTPTPCESGGGWWADGVANAPYTVEVNGCGPTGLHRCHDTFEQACRAWKEARLLEPVVGPDGKRYWPWGTPPNPQYKWVGEQCNRYQSPGGRRFAGPGGIGVEQTEGYGAPCPEPTPEQTPTPPPGPTPTPDPDCSYTHFNLVWLCAEPSKPGCLDGKDWGRPGIVHIRRDGKPICDRRQCVRAFLTAVLFNDREKIEAGHACFPGPIPEYMTETDADGNECTPTTCETSWFQTWPPDLRFDCGHPWGEGWNNGSCNIDFAARNTFTLEAFGVRGETTMTSDWR